MLKKYTTGYMPMSELVFLIYGIAPAMPIIGIQKWSPHYKDLRWVRDGIWSVAKSTAMPACWASPSPHKPTHVGNCRVAFDGSLPQPCRSSTTWVIAAKCPDLSMLRHPARKLTDGLGTIWSGRQLKSQLHQRRKGRSTPPGSSQWQGNERATLAAQIQIQ